jgi:hypothetical protein
MRPVKLAGMNILIENNDTLEYLTATGAWTKDPLAGKYFSNPALAFRAARQEAMGKFTIVAHISETHQFVNLNHGRGTGTLETTPA